MSDDIGKRLDEFEGWIVANNMTGLKNHGLLTIARQQQAEIARLREGLTGILRKAGYTTTADDLRALLETK